VLAQTPADDVISGPDNSSNESSRPEINAGPLDFDSFYVATIDSLTGALAATLNSSDLGRDAASEAMVRACERWGKVQHHKNPAGWCYRVGLNWATSRWRRRRREALTEPIKFSGFVSKPSAELHLELHAAVQKLPYSQRSVIVLRYWMGWSLAEIATALEIAEGTVSSRLNRALKALRVHAKEAR